MTPETARRRPGERTDVEVTEEVAPRIAPATDDREPRRLAELLAEVAARLLADLPDLATCPDDVWRVGMAFYHLRGQHCCAQTYAQGRRDEGDEWTDVTVAACQAAKGTVEAAAARRKRTEYATRPQTPEQIAARARYSWDRAEREIAEQAGRHAG